MQQFPAPFILYYSSLYLAQLINPDVPSTLTSLLHTPRHQLSGADAVDSEAEERNKGGGKMESSAAVPPHLASVSLMSRLPSSAHAVTMVRKRSVAAPS